MSVTASLDHFQAVSEFWHFTDTCGETAGLVVEHCKDGVALNGPDVDAVRADMAANGYPVAGGLKMSEVVDYFQRHRHLDIHYVNQYGSTWDGGIHQTCLDHAGRDGIILEVELAYNLTGNEPGVRRHFIAIGAIHPTLGYLVANGDDVRALNAAGGHGQIIPCRWMNKDVLAMARPSAAAVVYGLPHTLGLTPAALAIPSATLNEARQVEDAPAAGAAAPVATAAETPATLTPPTPTGDAVALYLSTLTGPAADATPLAPAPTEPAAETLAAPAPQVPAPVEESATPAPASPLAELRGQLDRASAGLAYVLRVIDELRQSLS